MDSACPMALILAGQTPLRDRLRLSSYDHITQRLTVPETREYIAYHLRVAGRTSPPFTPEAIEEIFQYARGIPRRVNHVCANSLLAAFIEQRELHPLGMRVVLVNPYHVEQSKELGDNSQMKSDRKDALVVASLVQQGRFLRSYSADAVYILLEPATSRAGSSSQRGGKLQPPKSGWEERKEAPLNDVLNISVQGRGERERQSFHRQMTLITWCTRVDRSPWEIGFPAHPGPHRRQAWRAERGPRNHGPTPTRARGPGLLLWPARGQDRRIWLGALLVIFLGYPGGGSTMDRIGRRRHPSTGKLHIADNRHDILPMSAVVVWLWCFPLFGPTQSLLNLAPSSVIAWNISFLTGHGFGLWLSGRLAFRVVRRYMSHLGLWVALGLSQVVVFASSRTTALVGLHTGLRGLAASALVFATPFLMGAAISPYVVSWAVGVAAEPTNIAGRRLGSMMAAAAIAYGPIAAMSRVAPTYSFGLASLLLLVAAALSGHRAQSGRSRSHPSSAGDKPGPHLGRSLVTFWMSYAVLVSCCSVLGGFSHTIVFRASDSAGPIAPFIGALAYACFSLVAGCLADMTGTPLSSAVTGVVLIGVSFLLIPLALTLKCLVALRALVESGCAFIDLSIWALLVSANRWLGGQPQQWVGRGLSLNVLAISAGVALSPTWGSFNAQRANALATVSAALAFAAVLPAMYLLARWLSSPGGGREMPPGAGLIDSLEPLTKRESEVVGLILAGNDDRAIMARLNISPNTLKTHLRHIYSKTGVHTRAELILRCRTRETPKAPVG